MDRDTVTVRDGLERAMWGHGEVDGRDKVGYGSVAGRARDC
jgi:hypothetical protein